MFVCFLRSTTEWSLIKHLNGWVIGTVLCSLLDASLFLCLVDWFYFEGPCSGHWFCYYNSFHVFVPFFNVYKTFLHFSLLPIPHKHAKPLFPQQFRLVSQWFSHEFDPYSCDRVNLVKE